jgi:hypothetical protein
VEGEEKIFGRPSSSLSSSLSSFSLMRAKRALAEMRGRSCVSMEGEEKILGGAVTPEDAPRMF